MNRTLLSTLLSLLVLSASCATTAIEREGVPPTAIEQRPVPVMGDINGGLSIADQSLKPDDVQLRQIIREALLADPFLSNAAKAVNIVSNEHRVTLRGIVDSERERESIGNYAVAIAGENYVDNFCSSRPPRRDALAFRGAR